ncbi:MAG: hypothetical protein SFZ24_00485 [Planctomycetota bacterium]|nr:hypothetical protein [Planctomycetota bacterium]
MRRSTAARRAAGLTLLELLLAVAITTMVGLAMTTVMTSVARGMTGIGDVRSALQRAHAAYVRLRAYTDPALCLLQHDPDKGFAIWLEDAAPGRTVNLREIRAFWFEPDQKTITVERVVFPEAWPEAMKAQFDAALTPQADFLFAIEAQRALGYTQRQTLVDGMSAFTLTHDDPAPQNAKSFTLELLADAGDQDPEPVFTLCSFPNHLAPH